MSEFLKLLLSLSLSGTVITLILLFLRGIFRNTVSMRWRYYVWLIVFARLLLPVTIPESPVGTLFSAEPAAAKTEYQISMPENSAVMEVPAPVVMESAETPAGAASSTTWISIPAALFAVWGVTALLLLMRRTTQYQSFTRYLRAGSMPVSDPALLDRYAEVCASAAVSRPPELRLSTLTATPMLIGIRKPYIVLPVSVGDCTLEKVLLHELLHHKRHDVLYKWFAQAVLCLHWFNPVVWLAVRALEQDCELACDESALHLMQPEEHRIYGDALLQAVRTGGGYRSEVASLALSENAKQLKERLGMIMNFRTRTRTEKALAVCLTAALCIGSVAAGAYAAETPRTPVPVPVKQNTASSAPQKQDTAVKADASTPEGTLELAMRAIKNLDTDALCRYSNNQKITFGAVYYDGQSTMFGNGAGMLSGQKGPALLGGKQDLYPEIVRSLSWKIKKSSVSGDTAKIELQITNRDFGSVIAEIVSRSLLEAASDKESHWDSDELKLFKAVPDNKPITLTVSSELKKANGNWELQIEKALANAVCGNLLDGGDSPASQAKIKEAEKVLDASIKRNIDWDEINRSMKDALAEAKVAVDEANIEKQISDAMKDAFR